ncbi:hypothetical protein OPV22_007994 [Ensete ventricosum]|uniref:HTH myb-type domain-containing protein n=2 Tax=Ensete ventricosum TaxID=4639 RepID=A0AAV8RB96_ENSVE|nr:hypothetical protein OPV22_007994 [Ensete ventricosum]
MPCCSLAPDPFSMVKVLFLLGLPRESSKLLSQSKGEGRKGNFLEGLLQHLISMDMEDKRVPSVNGICMPNKRNKQLYVHIRPSIDQPQLKEFASSTKELPIRVRKPYTITKQRERWTEDEHEKFLEAIKLHGRVWRRIQEHIGTKSAIQIRSHAQKFFSKVDRNWGTGNAIEIPPPRPKRKPLHPYPRKMKNLCTTRVPDMKRPEQSSSPIPSFCEQESGSPVSVLSAVGSETMGSWVSKPLSSCASPLSSVVGSDPVELSLNEPENRCCSPTSSVEGEERIWYKDPASNGSNKLDKSSLELHLGSQDQIHPKECSPVEPQLTRLKLFGRTVLVANSQKTCSSDDGNATQHFMPLPSAADVGSHEEKIYTDMQNQAPGLLHLLPDEYISGKTGRIPWDVAALPMYYFLVPNGVQKNSADEMVAPMPFWPTFYGRLPISSANQMNTRLKQELPQTSTEAPSQTNAVEEGSSVGSSSPSAWNESIMDDGNHSPVGSEGSAFPKEPMHAFRLKPSENSAFVSVKASKIKSPRGFGPYERCKSGK